MPTCKDEESAIIRNLQTANLSAEERRKDVARLYSDYFREVVNYLIQLGASKEDAEDLAHDALIKVLYTKINSFEARPDGSFRAWLFRIVRNQYFNMQKREQKNKSLPENESAFDGFSPEDTLYTEFLPADQGYALSEIDLQYYLENMIDMAKLTELEAQVIKLIAYFGLKPNDIAEAIPGQSSPNVSRILYNARKKLQPFCAKGDICQ